MKLTFPPLFAALIILVAGVLAADLIKTWRETSHESGAYCLQEANTLTKQTAEPSLVHSVHQREEYDRNSNRDPAALTDNHVETRESEKSTRESLVHDNPSVLIGQRSVPDTALGSSAPGISDEGSRGSAGSFSTGSGGGAVFSAGGLSANLGSANQAVTQSEGFAQASSASVNIPAVFGNSSVVASLSPAQQEAVAQIASNFTSTVQSSGAAPNSPEYRQAWDNATFQANQQYESTFGIDSFNQMLNSQTN